MKSPIVQGCADEVLHLRAAAAIKARSARSGENEHGDCVTTGSARKVRGAIRVAVSFSDNNPKKRTASVSFFVNGRKSCAIPVSAARAFKCFSDVRTPLPGRSFRAVASARGYLGAVVDGTAPAAGTTVAIALHLVAVSTSGSERCPPPLVARPDQGLLDIDWAFISEREGGQRLTGYVPEPEKSKSGVTIGTGIDLGARSRYDISRLDISPSLKDKLRPYCGLKKEQAVQFLEEHPLVLESAEADSLDKAVKQPILFNLRDRYNRAVVAANRTDKCKRVRFEDLPRNVQTVIASLSFQLGGLSATAPIFWEQVTKQRWQEASDNLRNFGDNYPMRRGLEADLLDLAIADASPGPRDH